MNKEKIKVAVIGCGRISGHHCRSVRQVEGLSLGAVCDLQEDKARQYSREFDIPFYTNYHTMLTRHPEIDLVVIATPSGMHFEHSMEIMKLYGKNVVVEKPTFLRLSEAKAAYEMAGSQGVSLFPVFQNRFNLAVQRVARAIRENELGKINLLSVRVRWCRPQRYYDLSQWRGTYAMDGGALTNQGVHHVDLIRYLGGEVEGVHATMRTLGAKIEVEDTVVATLKFQNGSVGVLEVTTAARPDDFEASISLVGEKGLAQLGGIAVNELQTFTPNPGDCPQYSENFSGSVYGNGHRELYQQIADFFHKGIPYSIGQDDCLKTLGLLHAFYGSDEQGRWVHTGDGDFGGSKRLGKTDEALSRLYRTPRV